MTTRILNSKNKAQKRMKTPRPELFEMSRIGCRHWVWLLIVSVGALTSRAVIPEPPNILYGTITLEGALVTAAMTNVVVEARRAANGPIVASYRMGADPQVGDFYSLRVPVESVLPIADASSSQVGDSVLISLRDANGLRAQTNFTIVERGHVQRADFGGAAVDGDGDGLPDPWELYRFGNLGQVPGNPGAGGLTVLQHFIAGTDPNNPQGTFHLRINRTNNLDRVWFVAEKAEGPGYEGMTRTYTLESRPDLVTSGWTNVPGFINRTATNQTVEYFTPGPNVHGFFRVRISLLGFD